MLNYSEDPKTIGLYPDELLEEDLTPDLSGYEAQCNEILAATKGENPFESSFPKQSFILLILYDCIYLHT